jgi:predicted alpha-1,2-mannosidase
MCGANFKFIYMHHLNEKLDRMGSTTGLISASAWTLFLAVIIGASPVQGSAATEPVDCVNVFIGTGGHGHTYPGATTPFGLVQLSPDTPTKGWDGCGGYHYSDSKILGFSHTHLSGTGIPDLGDLLVMPVAGALQESENYQALTAERMGSGFFHTNEIATPGYYRVWLDKYKVAAELTATPHAGMHRYTFSTAGEGHLILDLVRGIGCQPTNASFRLAGGNLITGYRATSGWAKQRSIYFAIESSKPFKSAGFELNGKPLPDGKTNAEGKNIRAHLDFDVTPATQICLRVGLSPTSVEEAVKNLRAEMPSWNFDEYQAAAKSTWNEQLSRLRIESADPALREKFYTALYHTMCAPTLFNDVDGSYRGPDGQNHTNANFQYYCTFSLWDTFRAEHPLLALAQPDRMNDFVQSMVAFYQQSPDRALPMWPLASFETWCMIGYHSVPVIWDAYAKGFRGFDAELAYQAMRETAMANRYYQDEYQKYGYIPQGRRRSSVARTLEFSYDDWCIAQMAKALNKTEDAELFTKRSQGYTNLFDPEVGFFRAKTAEGKFEGVFDPKRVSFDDYIEADAWHYTFAAMHDVPGMIRLYGGEKAFVKKLDEMFNEDSEFHPPLADATGLIGQYAHGNEPCHHVAYLYALAGTQYKTALRAHQIMALHYNNTVDGICGNDDCGQMSAWYVWSAMGLYPLNPADGIYVIGSPAMEKTTIRLDPKLYKGGTFTVVAHNVSNQNIYVQSAKLNGQPLARPWVTHEEITRGGTLEFEMGLLPNKVWAAAPVKTAGP